MLSLYHKPVSIGEEDIKCRYNLEPTDLQLPSVILEIQAYHEATRDERQPRSCGAMGTSAFFCRDRDVTTVGETTRKAGSAILWPRNRRGKHNRNEEPAENKRYCTMRG